MASVVEADGLTKTYGPVDALRGVSFEIPSGAWGLLGPNGAGKTTLLRILLGLTGATRGTVTVLGEDPQRSATGIREKIGFVPEGDAHVPGLTGVQFVAFAGRLCGLPGDDAKQRAHAVLNFVGLEEERYRDVADYSKGMLQRAKLAQALVHDPGVLFLDEPTNGLDPDGREAMLALIRGLAVEHGISVVLASHVLPEVEAVCDGALVLDQGRVVANASLDELKERQQATFRVRVRGSVDAFEAALDAAGASLDQTREGTLMVMTPKGEGAVLVLEAAQEAGVQVRQVEPARASLEDALVTTLEEASR